MVNKRILIFTAIIILTCLGFVDRALAASYHPQGTLTSENLLSTTWWDADWSYRKEIPLTGAGSAGTNYQKKIIVGYSSGGDLHCESHCQADFDDIRFVDGDQTTELDYWRETYTESGTATFWVEVKDSLSSGQNPDIYMYYGNDSADTASNYDNAFVKDYGESGLVGLWHFDDGSGDTASDSSGQGNNGNLGGSDSCPGGTHCPAWVGSDGGNWDSQDPVQQFSSGDSLSFGGDDYIDCGNIDAPVEGTTSWTVEWWENRNNFTGYQMPIGTLSHVTWAPGWLISSDGTNYSLIGDNDASFANGYILYSQAHGSPTGQWVHYAITRSGNTFQWYRNGAAWGSSYTSSIVPANGHNLTIGAGIGSDGVTIERYFNGTIDEMRIYDRPLSENEIKCHHERRKYSSSEPSFGSIGSETTGLTVGSIDSFDYNASSKPADTTLKVQFSQNGTTWCDSSNDCTGNAYDILSEGSHNIDLSGLSWSGANFYYKATFESNPAQDATPLLDSIGVNYTLTLSSAPTAPTLLQCEGETNPTGVTDTTPEFTAIGNDPDSGDTLTHAYIQVGTTKGASDMWDSDWIDIDDFTEGTRCQEIIYDGSALSLDGSIYYWRIKFKDDSGDGGAWSSTQFTVSDSFTDEDKVGSKSNTTVDTGAGQVKLDSDTVELDYMEYSTDELAQAAYVSSDSTYTADQCTGGSCIEGSHYSTYVCSRGFDDNPSLQWVGELTDDLNYLGYSFSSSKQIRKLALTSQASYTYMPTNFTLRAADTAPSSIEDAATHGTLLLSVSGITWSQDETKSWEFNNSNSYTSYWVYMIDGPNDYYNMGEMEMMETHLQCYSEDTIKEQGTYSLKAVARITDSLNDTLTRTVEPTIDLSGKNTIKYDIYAERTGSYIKIGIHDSGGTTTEHTANVLVSDTNQTETWDISGVADENKDVIDSIIITIVNADADNTFYIDNMYFGSGGYYSSGTLTSTNLLDGETVGSIDSFDYNLSAKPSGTGATVGFNQDGGSTWYDAAGDVGTETLITDGEQTITLTSGWSGANFYYKATFESNPAQNETPLLDSIGVNYSDYAPSYFTMNSDQAPTAPTLLQCEGETNPTGVTDTTPEFTAIGNDPDSGDTLTHAYIQVGTTIEGSDMWDSSAWIDIADFTEGTRCQEISYAGSALSLDGSTYYWRIKFKDDSGAGGVWSSTQFTVSDTFTDETKVGSKSNTTVDTGNGQVKLDLDSVELDYMEYSTDELAQAAYVSSDEYSADLTTPAMTSNTTPSPFETSASSEWSASYAAWKAFDDEVSTRWNMASAGTSAGQWLKFDFGSGNVYTVTKLRIMNYASVVIHQFKLQGSNNGSSWTDIYTGDCVDNSDWQEFIFNNSNEYRYYRLYCVSGWNPNGLSICEIELMETSLQCYSEDTIKEQGSYSLKAVALATDSFNDTLTRTVEPTIDLSGKNVIKYDIYAERTGSYIKIGIHDSGGTTTEHTANVLVSDTNQTETWDISGVADENKDVIDSIIITIVNADADNTFYIDNMYFGGGYYSSGTLTSINLLDGETVGSIDSFDYNASAKPTDTELKVQFSQNGTTWCDSSNDCTGNAYDTLSEGSHNISLSTLDWSGANFYYKTTFESNSPNYDATPLLDSIGVNYSDYAPSYFTMAASSPGTFTIKKADDCDCTCSDGECAECFGGYCCSGSCQSTDCKTTYPEYGRLESSTFDTGIAGGVAYNAIMWKGNAPGGTNVKLQLAASDSQDDPWTFYGGAACSENDYYTPLKDIPAEIKCYTQFNNKRYFRYKVFLHSYQKPSGYDDLTPTVEEVIVNYSE